MLTRRLESQDVISALHQRFNGKLVPPFELAYPDGRTFRIGDPANQQAETMIENPAFRITLKTDRALRAVNSLDEYSLAQSYLLGEIDIEGDFLAVMGLRKYLFDRHPGLSLWRLLRPMLYGQSRNDKKFVPEHYDNGDDFYFSFLDREFHVYSQALFKCTGESLEEAARNKMDYIRQICRLGPSSRVLDVGAGWGSFARHAASLGANVTMLTISHRQYEYLSKLVTTNCHPGTLLPVFESIYDFECTETFDAIVILGVMEHLPDYAALFKKFENLLRPDGRIYMDFAATRKKYSISTFTYRYVFQGNHSPVFVPGLIAAANRRSFELVAIHNDRHSYFLTLQAWAKNLEAERDNIVKQFGQKIFRLFRLYLWATAYAMGCDGQLESYRVVFQKSVGRPSAGIGLSHFEEIQE
jgi:cyclopropane-fatty-acyl-phospholipid synthase